MRLAIITTHPIQYYAPLFKLLHERQNISINVFYTWGESAKQKHDPEFKQTIEWDIPLLDGYPYQWVKNTAEYPGSHHFKGIINPVLIEQIIDWRADAILVFGWAYHSHLKAMRYFKNKVPVYFRGDSTLLDEQKGIKRIARSIFLKWVYRQTDHAFYVGTQNKAYFKKYGLKESQLTFAPHAVDNQRFSTSKAGSRMQIRTGLGISDTDILVLFAGKLEQKKAPDILLKAFSDLNVQNLHLLVVGNGEMEAELKAPFVDTKKNNIHWLDFQNQSAMPDIYHACDLFCLPSKGPGESWGLAVNEAMAAGKAILVSDKVGCAADLVLKKRNGAIFNSGDIESLMAYTILLTISKTLLHQYGEESKIIIADWSLINCVKAIEGKLLNEV